MIAYLFHSNSQERTLRSLSLNFLGTYRSLALLKNISLLPWTNPEGGWIDELLNMDPFRRGMVSILYEVIQRTTSPSLDHIRRQWEKELGMEISDSAWQCAIELVHSSSVCIRHGLMQFKVLHRLHLSRSKLAKMYPGSDSSCPRCGLEPADLSHMFWDAPD